MPDELVSLDLDGVWFSGDIKDDNGSDDEAIGSTEKFDWNKFTGKFEPDKVPLNAPERII